MENQGQAQQPIALSLQDLRVLAGAVEIGASRGAYRANEMEIVGAMYNKLTLFLKANTPAEEAKAPTEANAPVASAPGEVTEKPEAAI